MDELASSNSVPSIGLGPVGEWEGGVSDKGSDTLVPPSFPCLYLALTVIQKSKTSESNLLVSARSCFELLGSWTISWGRSVAISAQRVKQCLGERLKALSTDSRHWRCASAQGTQSR